MFFTLIGFSRRDLSSEVSGSMALIAVIAFACIATPVGATVRSVFSGQPDEVVQQVGPLSSGNHGRLNSE
jgi:hypothetical protein